jgi:hypothetical protein
MKKENHTITAISEADKMNPMFPLNTYNAIVHSIVTEWPDVEDEEVEEFIAAQLIPYRETILEQWRNNIMHPMGCPIPRIPRDIYKATEELRHKVWYNRCHLHTLAEGPAGYDPKHWEDCVKAGKRVVRKYGRKNLGPYTDFEWGMINGKLSALRWVLGDDWDFLDT